MITTHGDEHFAADEHGNWTRFELSLCRLLPPASMYHLTPPGDPGTPPHRHPGPAFGFLIEGEMLFELEGKAPYVVRAGEAFWEPGGDVIHYQNANNRDDIPVRYTVTMLCEPGKPLFTLVDEEELAQRKDRRVPRES